MKLLPAHQTEIRKQLETVAATRNTSLRILLTDKEYGMRYLWQLYSNINWDLQQEVYAYCNDDNIETFFRKLIKQVVSETPTCDYLSLIVCKDIDDLPETTTGRKLMFIHNTTTYQAVIDRLSIAGYTMEVIERSLGNPLPTKLINHLIPEGQAWYLVIEEVTL